jgi:hypothetical protein
MGVIADESERLREQLKSRQENPTAIENPADENQERQCLSLEKRVASAEIDLSSLQTSLVSTEEERDRTKAELESCTEKCGYLKLKHYRLESEAAILKTRKIPKAEEKLVHLKISLKPCEKVESPDEVAGDGVERTFGDLIGDVVLLESTILSFIDDAGKYEGGTAAVFFETPFSSLIAEFKNLNPQIAVLRMTGQSALSFDIATPNSIQTPALMDISVPNILLNLKATPISQAYDKNIVSTHFSESASGKVVLSLPAACAAFDSTSGESKPDFDKFSSHLAANVSFKYYVQVGRSYKVTYDLNEIMVRIKKNTTKNGIFRTSATSEVTNFNRSDEVIRVEAISEDPNKSFPPEFIARIKKVIIDRALAQVARAYLPDQHPLVLTNPSAPNSSAPGLSGKLRQCSHKYCQAGAIILDLGHALFGGNESVASWTRENSIHTEETYSEKSMIEEFSGFAFRPGRKQ